MYYDINRTLSYNAFINIVVGSRGFGKSYSWKRKAVNDFMKKKKQFVYIRRTADEIRSACKTLFADIVRDGITTGEPIEYKESAFWIESSDVPIGFAIPLSTAYKYKSSSYIDVTNICFDEFLAPSPNGFLKNEVFLFNELLETVLRTRDDAVIFMFANALTMINPYTIAWKLEEPKIKPRVKNGILVQLVTADDEFKNVKKQTKLAKVQELTGYTEYSIENKFALDNEIPIQKKGKNSVFRFAIKIINGTYGVWYDYATGLHIVSRDYEPNTKAIYEIEKQEAGKAATFPRLLKATPLLVRMKRAFDKNEVTFESKQVYYETTTLIKLFMGW